MSALAGADACTMSYETLREMYLDLTTEKRTADFLAQWRKVYGDRDWLTGIADLQEYVGSVPARSR